MNVTGIVFVPGVNDSDEGKMSQKLGAEPMLISKDTSKVKVYITPIDEELMVAKNTYGFIERR